MAVNLLDFDLDGLAAFCERLGEKRFRATQLFRWIHQKGAADFDEMTDLAKSLREKLKDVHFRFSTSNMSNNPLLRPARNRAARRLPCA